MEVGANMKSFAITMVEAADAVSACNVHGPRAANSNAQM
jgi:hypothetical protein